MVKVKFQSKFLKSKRLKIIEGLFGLIVFITVLTVIGKYTYSYLKQKYSIYSQNRVEIKIQKQKQAYICAPNLITIEVTGGGKVCRETEPESIYRTIFDTYALDSNQKEQIYSLFSEGELVAANQLMQNVIPVERYATVSIPVIKWNEDPFKDKYWRFSFYGFRPFINLFFATKETNDPIYLKKAEEITLSFINKNTNQSYIWDDNHAVSFRAMYLVKLWWQLRENNLLTYKTSRQILQSIEKHANFLADPNHYDKQYNHGLNETVALYLISVNFPDLPKAKEWLNLSRERLATSLTVVVDPDGVLIENSPYYHLYTLEKYWEIYKYSLKYNFPISDSFNNRLEKMINYATYILQPDQKIPLLGASLEKQINNHGIYQEMSDKFPTLKYVLTRGMEGRRPKEVSIVFPSSKEVILRSGWGKKSDFLNQTQIVFDAGPYRTNHSDLDTLSFSLYGNNLNLMPDAGLYTYELGAMKDYFRGTSAHNTVTVDGLDQQKGSGTLGELVQENGFASQSGEHQLYRDVVHKRNISLVGKKYVVIIDKLTSNKTHLYSQIFHLFPGARIKIEGTTVRVYKSGDISNIPVMSIYTIVPTTNLTLKAYLGQHTPTIKGICSLEYQKAIPCYQLEYTQKGQNVTYMTLIEIGEPDKRLLYSYNGSSLHIQSSVNNTTMNISETVEHLANVKVQASQQSKPDLTTLASLNLDKWIIATGTMSTSKNGVSINMSDTGRFSATQIVEADLSKKNIEIKASVTNLLALNTFDIALSSNNWEGYAIYNLESVFRSTNNREWLNISLGKGRVRDGQGEWKIYGQNFDWSRIDGIKIIAETDSKILNPVQLASIQTYSQPKEGEVVIVFDDGYESILSAVDVMEQYNFKGNIAVIADRVEGNQKGYLSLSQLHTLQDKYNWNIVNHSQSHLDAVEAYYNKNYLNGFEKDILSGAKFLTDNNLNTVPNWYIYPHGSSNQAIKDIVGKYYTFARTTINAPESYPFGDPLAVKTISADGIESNGVQVFNPVSTIEKAILDAKKYNLSLFITFHRIHSTSTDRPGYDIKDFKKLMQFISDQKIKVKTLKQYDLDHEVRERSLTFIEGVSSQLEINVTKHRLFFLKKLLYDIRDILTIKKTNKINKNNEKVF